MEQHQNTIHTNIGGVTNIGGSSTDIYSEGTCVSALVSL